MIYVTGDLHGDFSRLQSPKLKKLKKGDFLIVCGDFGFLWDGSREEQQVLNKLGKLKYTILFVDGVHENFQLLDAVEEQDWKGGRVGVVRPNVLHLHRGEFYELEGKTFFTLGGGDELLLDVEAGEYNARSMPTMEQLRQAYHKLEERDFTMDYIITHDCSSKVKQFLDLNAQDGAVHLNYLNSYFEALYERAKFRHWFFGAYHMDKRIPPRCSAVYREILPIGE